MDIPRKLGIIVFGMVPAIIGGCVTYDLTGGNYTAVGVYVAILYLFLGGLVSR